MRARAIGIIADGALLRVALLLLIAFPLFRHHENTHLNKTFVGKDEPVGV